jgi:hypothetical protein
MFGDMEWKNCFNNAQAELLAVKLYGLAMRFFLK